MILVTWAQSFGLNEHGLLQAPADQPAPEGDETLSYISEPFVPPEITQVEWRNKAEEYLREILELLDYHSILRRPSLDGLRALLLLLPLMDGKSSIFFFFYHGRL